MKNVIKISLAIVTAAFVCGCNDAEYGVGSPRAYLVESTQAPGVNGSAITMTDNGADVSVTISLTDKINEDASFRIVVDENVLNTYNSEQSASYILLDPSYYQISEEPVVIKAGEYAADPVDIHINFIPVEARELAMGLPLRLEAVSGNVSTTSVSSQYVYTVPAVLRNGLAQYNGASGLRAEGFDTTLPTGFTIEVRFQVSNTSNRNRDVFSNGKSVLFRFEDPQSDQGDVKAHSAVQFQGSPAYINPEPLVGFATNVWQHLAFTWDGSTGNLYYNGKKVGTKAITRSDVGDGEFPVASWFGGATGDGGHGTGSSWWVGCNILFTEARIWSTVRTESQISNNMSAVPVDSEGLVGYWRINKETYTDNDDGTYSFEDLSGNGHPLVSSTSFKWNEDISSEDESTPWI